MDDIDIIIMCIILIPTFFLVIYVIAREFSSFDETDEETSIVKEESAINVEIEEQNTKIQPDNEENKLNAMNDNSEEPKSNNSSSKQMLIIGLVILGLNILSVAGTYVSNGYNIISATATSIGANIFVIIGGLLCYFAYKNKK